MGKITTVHTGQNGKVQVTTVKTAGAIFKRPIMNLVSLLQEEDKENNSVVVGSMSEPSA